MSKENNRARTKLELSKLTAASAIIASQDMTADEGFWGDVVDSLDRMDPPRRARGATDHIKPRKV